MTATYPMSCICTPRSKGYSGRYRNIDCQRHGYGTLDNILEHDQVHHVELYCWCGGVHLRKDIGR